jgi:hypothetical protein
MSHGLRNEIEQIGMWHEHGIHAVPLFTRQSFTAALGRKKWTRYMAL